MEIKINKCRKCDKKHFQGETECSNGCTYGLTRPEIIIIPNEIIKKLIKLDEIKSGFKV